MLLSSSYEKKLFLDPGSEPQKYRWLFKIPKRAIPSNEEIFQQHLCIWTGGLSTKDNLMLIHVLLQGAGVNGVVYIELLKIWITSITHGRPGVVQYSGQSQRAHKTQ